MVIVVDGPDGVGKSTTIQGLMRLLPNSISLGPKHDPKKYPTVQLSLEFELKKLQFAKELDTLYSYVFVDRSVFTTIIYSEVYDGVILEKAVVEKLFQTYSTLVDKTIILSVKDPLVLIKRIKARSKTKKIDKTYESDLIKQAAVNEKFSRASYYIYSGEQVIHFTDKPKNISAKGVILALHKAMFKNGGKI